jgi:hypothetical protein
MLITTRSSFALALLLNVATAVAAERSARVDRPAPKSGDPPKGAIVLFDGSNLDAWASQKDRKWEETDGPADWMILEDGSLEVVPDAGSLITRQKFGDFKLHLEYRLLGPPTNGGVFLMCRYELGIKQVADKEEPYAGAFENLKEPIRPLVRASKPPMEWQTFDVDFRAPQLDASGKTTKKARATVWLNGKLIHDDVELGPRKGAAKRLPDVAEAPLMLQEHGSAYQFRNIWIIDRGATERHARAE